MNRGEVRSQCARRDSIKKILFLTLIVFLPAIPSRWIDDTQLFAVIHHSVFCPIFSKFVISRVIGFTLLLFLVCRYRPGIKKFFMRYILVYFIIEPKTIMLPFFCSRSSYLLITGT